MGYVIQSSSHKSSESSTSTARGRFSPTSERKHQQQLPHFQLLEKLINKRAAALTHGVQLLPPSPHVVSFLPPCRLKLLLTTSIKIYLLNCFGSFVSTSVKSCYFG